VVLSLVAAAGLLLMAGVDGAKHRAAALALLDEVERSELAMIRWNEEVSALYDASDPGVGPSTATGEVLAAISARTANDLRSSRVDLDHLTRGTIRPWDSDLLDALTRYRWHQDVWIVYLDAVADDPDRLGDVSLTAEITPTFVAACWALTRLDEPFRRRATLICEAVAPPIRGELV